MLFLDLVGERRDLVGYADESGGCRGGERLLGHELKSVESQARGLSPTGQSKSSKREEDEGEQCRPGLFGPWAGLSSFRSRACFICVVRPVTDWVGRGKPWFGLGHLVLVFGLGLVEVRPILIGPNSSFLVVESELGSCFEPSSRRAQTLEV